MERIVCFLLHWGWKNRIYSCSFTPSGERVERFQCRKCGEWWKKK